MNNKKTSVSRQTRGQTWRQALLLIAALLLSMGFLTARPSMRAEAASRQLSTLKFHQVNRSMDVTGDGKNDAVLLTEGSYSRDSDMYEDVVVAVNGRRIARIEAQEYFKVDASLIRLKSGRIYLAVTAYGSDDYPFVSALYRFQTQSLIGVFDFKKMDQHGSRSNAVVRKVSGNTITVSLSSMNASTGWIFGDFDISESNSRLVWPKTGTVTQAASGKGKWLTARKKIVLYKNPTGSEKVAVINPGEKVYIFKWYIDGSNEKFKVSTKDGRKGYFKSAEELDWEEGFGYFKEAIYVG